MVRGFCIFLVVSLSCLFVLSDCGKKEVPVLRVMDSVNNKLVVLTGDRTKLSKFYNADFVILGGSLGGIAAALSICASGRTAILVEETDRIAGCFTLQDTSYFAENRYVETSGSSRTYQMFRSKIKDWYTQRSQPPPDIFPNLYPSLREFGSKNFCFETEAALDAINQMLERRIQRESLTVVKRHKVAKAITFKNRIASLIAVDLDEMTATQFTGWMFIDATKNGDLIPLLGPDYTIGRESKAETGEPHAPDAPDTLSAREVFYYRDIRESDSERESAQHYTIDLQKNPEARDNMVPWVVMKEPCRIKGYRRIVEQDGEIRIELFEDNS